MPVQSKPVKLTPFAAALAGALGGCFSTAVVYPLDVAKTQIQALPGSKDVSMFALLYRLLKREGLGAWYRGFGATMLNTFSMQYAYFFFYSFVRNAYISRLTRKLPAGAKLAPLSTAAELLLGAIAGALAQIFTIPVSVIATRQQVGRPEKKKAEKAGEPEDDSFIGVAKEIVEEEGVTGLWLGLKPGLVLTVNPAITYGLYERVKSMVLLAKTSAGSDALMSPGLSFVVGALSKTLATVVTYPYIMAKVRIQARNADERDCEEQHLPPPAPHKHHHSDKTRHPSALGVLKGVWKREGPTGWYQRFATEVPPVAPRKKPRTLRRIFYTTAALTGTFYVGSTFVAFNNQAYYDLFSDNVPLGQSMLEYAESHHWDTMTLNSLLNSLQESAVGAATSVQKFVTEKINGTSAKDELKDLKAKAEAKAKEVKAATVKKATETKETVTKKAAAAKEAVVKKATETKESAEKAVTEVKSEVDKKGVSEVAKEKTEQLSHEVAALARKAEEALADKTGVSPSEIVSSSPKTSDHVYTEPLPVGFEPPPGFDRPPPPKREKPKTPELPLVAPAVSSLGSSEPVISHLAGTIDSLASYLKSNPAAAERISGVLESAKKDLTSLSERIEKARDEERSTLEAKMDEQTREYTIKLLEAEMSAQDKLDSQEDEFRKMFDLRQAQLVQAYREKLENELQTQSELINERLKNEVVAQGIELQRRWIREVKMRVEEERGGRLAKIDELSAHLKRIERVALDNSAYLDENIRVHALWSAIRALTNSSLGSPVRKPFREELRVVRHIAAAREDPVVSAALETLEASDVPDVGVEPLADLTTWYASSVAPKVSNVALVPDQDAGLLSHLASHLLSSFRFKRQGLVEGNDVLSVLARAEHHLNEKDLDSAARELNQLRGSAKVLLHDWLEAARRRLEVEQALEVVQTQATLASLLVVQ
ncbi:MICOS complex subunit mic60 [Marasmius crinis-equi]|uniref:MICOS complex subunit MIC60 n=1 Tax=Marasmius crinis-equi TaxID=585013 RepID=A0ABR3FWS3_9AGAR